MRVYSARSLLLILILLLPAASLAMDLPHYDLNSLVYLSTDIVLADISKDARGNFTATVTESLYGSLHPGVKLDALTPFLMFFQPLNNGRKVILFLDRRPHKYDFLHQDAAKSPFAVPSSGVYLIDEYGHVHVQLAPEHGCVQPPDNQITFITRFYSTRAFATAKKGFVVPEGHIMLNNTKTGQSFDLKNVRSMGGSWSTLDGVLIFALDQLSDFPAGVYTLGMQYRDDEASEVQSVGHTMTVAITDTPDGKRLSIPPATAKRKAGYANRQTRSDLAREGP